MIRYDAGSEQETYELFLTRLQENTERLGIEWILEKRAYTSSAIRTRCGIH